MVQMVQSDQKPAARLGTLNKTGWLSDQPQDLRNWIARNGRWLRYTPRETLYLAGDTPDGLYGLANGTLELSFPLPGSDPVVFHRAEPGFWIGEAAILSSEPRMVTVTAASECLVFFVPAAKLTALLEAEPHHWRSFYDQSNRNLKTALMLLSETLSLTPRARLARLLLRIADPRGEVTGSQQELGQLVGMPRSTLRRALASLVKTGVVKSGYGRLVVADRAALERIATDR